MKSVSSTPVRPQRQLETTLRLVQSLRGQMPFLVTLSPAQRRTLRRVDQSILALLRATLDTAHSHAHLLPRAFELKEFAARVDDAFALRQIIGLLNALRFDLQDTLRVTVAEAMRDAHVVRASVYTAARRRPELHGVAKRIASRAFRGKRRGKTS